METLNLNIIKKCYPDSILLDVCETYYPNKGWVNTEKTITPYTSIQEVETRIKLRIANGATIFNFRIKDEFGQIKYPDYLSKELILKK